MKKKFSSINSKCLCRQVGEPILARAESAPGAALHPTGRLHGQDLLEGSCEGGAADAQQTSSRDAGGRKSMRRARSLTQSSVPSRKIRVMHTHNAKKSEESIVTENDLISIHETCVQRIVKLPQLLLKFITATV